MLEQNISKYMFFAIFVLVFVIAVRIAMPYLNYVLFAIILACMMRTPYTWLLRRVKKETIASLLVLGIILLFLIVPCTIIVIKFATEAPTAIGAVGAALDSRMGLEESYKIFGMNLNVSGAISKSIDGARNFFLERIPQLLQSVASILLGLFVMFCCLFYLLKRGPEVYEEFKEIIPLQRKYKTQLFSDMERVIVGVMYGQILTAIVQGFLGGLGFLIAGIPNAIFWGFIMIVLSFLPVIGPPVVWIPAVLYLLSEESYKAAIFLGLWCVILVLNIDNVIKPRIIGSKISLHPFLILIGVLGGLKLFGFVGLIIGPLVLSLLMVLIRVYMSDFHGKIEEREPN